MNASKLWEATKTAGAIAGLVLTADKVVEKTTGKDLWDTGVDLAKKVFSSSAKSGGQNA